MKPLRDRILVQADPERTYSGIIVQASKGIVDSQSQLGKFGTVTAIGPDVDKDQLKPGDRICFGEFEYPCTPQGEFILQDKDVCGVLVDANHEGWRDYGPDRVLESIHAKTKGNP